jgi:aldehyde dehydrogenase (NAD+)
MKAKKNYPLGALNPEWKGKTCLNYIDGKWMGSMGCRFIESRNPATGEIIGVVPSSGKAEIILAATAAKKAFSEWRFVPSPKIGEILFRAADILEKRKEELARLMTMEMGKVLKESRGDVQEGIDMFRFIAGEGRRLHGETTPSELPNKFAMTVRDPVGVCALITPWNFPIAIPVWKIAPALVCRNTIIFKPAEDTPICAVKLVEILLEAGLNDYPGVLNLVHGVGEEAGRELVKHPDVDLVSFTGSTETGKEIAAVCSNQYKKYSLEMGGKNAIIVMDDADIDLAVEGAVWGAFGTTGQRCTSASRLIVHKDVINEFINKLVSKTKQLKIGCGLEEEIDIGPLINESALEKTEKYVEIGKNEGAKIRQGGSRLKENWIGSRLREKQKKGHFFKPTIFIGVKPTMRIAQEEIFGPVVCVIECLNLEHAVEIANSVKYGLSASIYTGDINKALRAAQSFKTGLSYINASTIGAEVHLPFGGTKQTGNGHREGLHVLEVFTEWKTIYIDYSGKLQKAQIDNG